MGTKNAPAKFDCYRNAEPDEPMFVLLARDKDAPALITIWAHYRMRMAQTPADVEQAREALDVAQSMIAWRAKHRPAAVDAKEVHPPRGPHADDAHDGECG